ncbi:MAG TPA: four helix bundle protein [Acidobacteriaceae bacterium]|nr:four helix bundle protein [Acidobacteriaceae bacterium]
MTSSHRELKVWQRAVELSVALYKLTDNFPKQEIFGLTSQLRRAGVATASNIAEGYGRGSTADYKRFLAMARGSNLEAQTQLVIARELGFGRQHELQIAEGLSEEVAKMLVKMMNSF